MNDSLQRQMVIGDLSWCERVSNGVVQNMLRSCQTMYMQVQLLRLLCHSKFGIGFIIMGKCLFIVLKICLFSSHNPEIRMFHCLFIVLKISLFSMSSSYDPEIRDQFSNFSNLSANTITELITRCFLTCSSRFQETVQNQSNTGRRGSFCAVFGSDVRRDGEIEDHGRVDST